MLARLCCWIVVAALAGCAAGAQPRGEMDALRHAGFTPCLFETPTFVLYGLLRPARGGDGLLHVYIEGDGHAWRTRTQPSDDPTPRGVVTLRLAAADPSSNAVLYLARPCQFVRGAQARMCAVRYWTHARFAPEVIRATVDAIRQAQQRTGAKGVVLVGYSGGGGLAVLAASELDNVRFVGSVAGNLDHAAWTRWHRISPLHDSRNPVDVAARLREVPQRHLSSPADTVVPPAISEGYCRALGRPDACVQTPAMRHNGAWETVWSYAY